MRSQAVLRWIAGLVVVGVVAGLVHKVFFTGADSTGYTAYFSRSTGLYPGDDVRVLGVPVGEVDSVTPGPAAVKVRFHVRSDVALPPEVKAAIVAPNLVTSRFVQLAPAYVSGPRLRGGAAIPLPRTAVPIEWDDVKVQLTRLAKSLAPTLRDHKGALAGAIDTADANLTGSAAQLRTMLHTLSQASDTLAANRGNLFTTIDNLQQFVSTLVDSDATVRSFSAQLSSAAELLATNRSSLSAALAELDDAVGRLTRFTKQNRPALKSSLESVSALTATLTTKQYQVAELLHVAPTALDNFYNIVDPRYHAATGIIAVANFGDTAQLICRSIVSTGGTVDMCLHLLTPLLKQLCLSGLPTSVSQGAASAQACLHSLGSSVRSGVAGGPTPRRSGRPPNPRLGGLLTVLLPGGGQ